MAILRSRRNESCNYWYHKNHMIMLMEESSHQTMISIKHDGDKGDNACNGDR